MGFFADVCRRGRNASADARGARVEGGSAAENAGLPRG